MAEEPFVWGSGGSRESMARRRKVAEALMAKGSDYSPVQHWTQGLARVADALSGTWEGMKLDKQEKAYTAEDAKIAAGLVGSIPGAASAAALPSMAGGAPRTMAMPAVSPEIKDGITQTASALGIAPVDLATAISYETGGTFDPTKAGPTTKWGQHRGLIQFGEPQAKQHGVDWSNPVGSQLGPNGAVASYLRTAGVKPGMGLLDVYSAINAGAPGLYNRSDAAAGGAPGTVRDKVEQQMQGHRAKAQALFRSAQADLPAEGAMPVEATTGQPGFAVPGQPAMTGQTFNAIQGGQPLDPVFQTEGAQQPWMGTALAQPAPMVAQAPMPPPRPADLALANPQADMPAPGAVQAMGQMPQVMPDLSNSPDGGMRQTQLAEEQARQGQASASPFSGVAQALGGGQGQMATAATPSVSPAVQQVAAAAAQNPSDPIVQALSNPAASDATQKIAMALLMKRIEGNDTRGVVMGERLIDPKSGRVIADYSNPNGASTEYGLAPIYGTDKDGKPAVIQLGKRGDAKQSALPQGFQIARDPIKVDGPTGTTLLDPQTRQQIGFVPKDNAKAEADKVTGKASGEASVGLPDAIAKADQFLGSIEEVRKHPGRDGWGGQGSTAAWPIIGNGLPGSETRDFVSRVDQLKGKSFIEAFSSLKGGGAVSEVEGAKATDAIARLDRAQSKTGFDAALNDLADAVRSSRDRARQKAGVSAPSSAAAAPVAPAAQGAPPAGVDAKVWKHMTPEERALWK